MRLEEDAPIELHGTPVDGEAVDLAFRSAVDRGVRRRETGMVDNVVCGCANFDSHMLPGKKERLAQCRIEQEELRPV